MIAHLEYVCFFLEFTPWFWQESNKVFLVITSGSINSIVYIWNYYNERVRDGEKKKHKETEMDMNN